MAQLGFWAMLLISAQCSGIQVESQTCLPYLKSVRAKSADQAEKTAGS